MIASEYAPLARVTLKVLPTLRKHGIHMGLGVVGEMGELIDAAKKVAIYGKAVDQTNRVEEVGDDFWYLFNYCVEYGVHPMALQAALDAGYSDGRKQIARLATEPEERAFDIAEILLQLSLALNAGVCQMLLAEPGSMETMQLLVKMSNAMGIVCAILDVDPSDAMDRNIAKLKARYGDKYSDAAALNRDTGAERAVLESNTAATLLPRVLVDGGGVPAELAMSGTSLSMPGADDFPLPGGKACDTDRPEGCESCQ